MLSGLVLSEAPRQMTNQVILPITGFGGASRQHQGVGLGGGLRAGTWEMRLRGEAFGW